MQEEIAASCAGAVGCDIKQLPRVEIGLSDDRQQVRTLATSLAATVASFAGAGAVMAATGGAAAPALLAALASGGSVDGLGSLVRAAPTPRPTARPQSGLILPQLREWKR